MIYMKKCMSVIFVLALSLMMSSSGFAGENALAYFMIDSDLATVSYQEGGRIVRGIGGDEKVAFVIYVNNADELRTFAIDLTWDPAKAAMRGDSGIEIEEDDDTINGADITLAEEANVCGAVSGIVEVDEDGHYVEVFSKMGGDPVVSDGYGLLYYMLLKTDSEFTTDDTFAVTVEVSVLNDSGVENLLGQKDFYVNGGVDVKTRTWGEIKSQFKD